VQVNLKNLIDDVQRPTCRSNTEHQAAGSILVIRIILDNIATSDRLARFLDTDGDFEPA
jgi:hypothetical protein